MSAIIKEYLKEYYELRGHSLPIDGVEELLSELEKYPSMDIALKVLWDKFSRKEWVVAIMELYSPKRFFSDKERAEIIENVDASQITEDKITKFPRLSKSSSATIDIDTAINKLWTRFPPKEWIAVFLVTQGYNFDEVKEKTGIMPSRVRAVFSNIARGIARELGGDYSEGRLYDLIRRKLGGKKLTKDDKRYIKRMLYIIDSSSSEKTYLKRREDDKLGDLRQAFDRIRE